MNKWLPSEIKCRLVRILANLFPVLDDLEDREPRLVERMDAPPLAWLPMAATRFHAYVAGCRGHEVHGFHIPAE